jgi:hypothetical protein
MAYIGPGEPFGDVGSEVGDYAFDLLYHLSVPLAAAKPARFEEPDYLALAALCNMEDIRPLIIADHPSVVGEGQARLDRMWTALHTALPFGEAERTWLMETRSEHSKVFDHEMPGVIGDQEGNIVASGLRQRVSGRNLMRRWLAWRREADEFTDQGTLDIARDALAGLIGLLQPRQALPKTYLELRREDDATT